ncbi:MAG: acylphosphatase [Firmicutes bacterium]|nr:acylphosphatase [Bacillota bacterium]
MSKDETRRFMRIGGKVHGVGFRYYALHHANTLGIKGYVRNTSDGYVEVDAQGPTSAVVEFMELMRRGPMSARVQSFCASARPLTNTYSRFEIRRTL